LANTSILVVGKGEGPIKMASAANVLRLKVF
jgi:hypothetical protein